MHDTLRFSMLALFFQSVLSFSAAPDSEKAFLAWMRATNRFYTGPDYHLRLGIFLAHSRHVHSHNSRSSFRLSLNHLAALTPCEYRALRASHPPPSPPSPRLPLRTVASYDWRDFGAVTGVKDQGLCGSDWAFAAVQSGESSTKITFGTLYTLSEQNLVDCVLTLLGCNGGIAMLAFDWVLQFQGGRFMQASDYPYTGTDGTCRFDPAKAAGQIYGYVGGIQGDEDDLAAKVVALGPAAAVVDASTAAFQLYSAGIFQDDQCSALDVNHGVGIVGFGVEGDTEFWIVKNSWGEDWGEAGYIRMLRGKNECGVASFCCIATSTK
jgi:cathepsin L